MDNKSNDNKKIPILQEADIVLVRNKKGLLRKLLRKVTKSHWDHVALVIFPKNKEKGFFNNLIIEAVDPRGIEIHKLTKYSGNPEKYDFGIKRMISLSEETRKRVLSFMLMNVDAPYYRLKLRRFLAAMISKKYSEKLLGRQRYVCSGFVQKSFYEAVNWDERDKVIFRDDYLSPMELQDITTPGDIARSEKTKWIYNKH